MRRKQHSIPCKSVSNALTLLIAARVLTNFPRYYVINYKMLLLWLLLVN